MKRMRSTRPTAREFNDPMPGDLDHDARVELLCYLVVAQLIAHARTGEWLRTDHLIESARIWTDGNGARGAWQARFEVGQASTVVAPDSLKVASLCDANSLANLFTDGWRLDDTAEAVSKAIACGYRHVVTAAVYDNENGVGEGIRNGLDSAQLSREDIFVTTKLWPGYSGWGEQPKSETQTNAEFDASLERLGLDYVDLYLIHSPHGGLQRIAQWRALLQLKQAAKARSIGVSNFNQKHIEEIKAAGLPLPEANQIELHPWSQKPELIAYMSENGIAPIAYSSLAPLSTWRVEAGQSVTKTSAMKRDGEVFVKMAAKYGVSEAQFLLRWGVQNGYAVLPKSLNPERMRQNLDIFGFSIDEKDMALIKTLDQGGGIAWGATGDPTSVE